MSKWMFFFITLRQSSLSYCVQQFQAYQDRQMSFGWWSKGGSLRFMITDSLGRLQESSKISGASFILISDIFKSSNYSSFLLEGWHYLAQILGLLLFVSRYISSCLSLVRMTSYPFWSRQQSMKSQVFHRSYFMNWDFMASRPCPCYLLQTLFLVFPQPSRKLSLMIIISITYLLFKVQYRQFSQTGLKRKRYYNYQNCHFKTTFQKQQNTILFKKTLSLQLSKLLNSSDYKQQIGMLAEFEKANLHKLLQSYTFEHVRPPPSVYSIQIPQSEYFTDVNTDTKRRKIYYNVLYSPEELKLITQVRAELIHHGLHERIGDELILKHAYVAKFDKLLVIQRLKDAIEYHQHPIVTRFDASTVSKLEKGIFYTYGCDKQMRPIVIMKIERVNFDQVFQQILNPFYYIMLIVYAFRLVPYHAEKATMIVDLKNVSLSSLPIFSLYDEMKKVAVSYCGCTERVLLYNASGMGLIWSVVSKFITESQRKKLVIIPEGEQHKALQYIDAYQLQASYGGKLPNLTEYWPIKSTTQEMEQSCFEGLSSDYFSVVNDQQFFISNPSQPTNGCCSYSCGCSIY